MADGTKIEWTDATWNPITGCSVTSPGCTNCYAMHLAGTRLAHHPSRAGLTHEVNGNHVWTGATRLNEQWLDQPLRWRKPRRIFVCAHGDLFHESVPDAWIDRVFAVMALAPQHTFQVLTKRAVRMREYLTHPRRLSVIDLPLPNVWLGVSVEDQARANERIPELLATPAAVRWLSMEPLLGPIDLYGGDPDPRLGGVTAGDGISLSQWWRADDPSDAPPRPGIDWVVVGGESGHDARPMHPDWARSLRDQCAAAAVPFFFKQWGEWVPGDQFGLQGAAFHRLGKSHAGRLLDRREHNAFPEVSHAD